MLAVDLTTFRHANELQTGIGIYAVDLLDQLCHHYHYELAIILRQCVMTEVQQHYPDAVIVPVADTGLPLNEQIVRFYKIPQTIKKLYHTYHIDGLFIPRYSAYSYISKQIPTVATMHDVDFIYSSSMKNKIRKYLISRSCVRTKNIVAISQYVKGDILRCFPQLSSHQVKVIYNHIPCPSLREVGTIPQNIKRSYILCVNSFKPSKNHITLLRAYQKIQSSINMDLVLIGYGDTAQVKKAISEMGLGSKVHILQNVSDEDMQAFYHHASLFVDTSTFEGFGRTPVEAAMYGLPVITSKDTSLYEVTQGLLEYYEPSNDDNALASKILQVVNGDVDYSAKRIQSIKDQYTQVYGLEKTSEIYAELFHKDFGC